MGMNVIISKQYLLCPPGDVKCSGYDYDLIRLQLNFDLMPIRLLFKGHSGHGDVTHYPQSRCPKGITAVVGSIFYLVYVAW